MIRSLVLFVVFTAWLLPEAAAACAVCYGGGEESRTAFILTTLFLSLTPVALIGGIMWWIWRRVREFELAPRSEEAAAEPASRPS